MNGRTSSSALRVSINSGVCGDVSGFPVFDGYFHARLNVMNGPSSNDKLQIGFLLRWSRWDELLLLMWRL